MRVGFSLFRLGCSVQGSEALDLGSRASGSGLRVSDLGFRM